MNADRDSCLMYAAKMATLTLVSVVFLHSYIDKLKTHFNANNMINYYIYYVPDARE